MKEPTSLFSSTLVSVEENLMFSWGILFSIAHFLSDIHPVNATGAGGAAGVGVGVGVATTAGSTGLGSGSGSGISAGATKGGTLRRSSGVTFLPSPAQPARKMIVMIPKKV